MPRGLGRLLGHVNKKVRRILVIVHVLQARGGGNGGEKLYIFLRSTTLILLPILVKVDFACLLRCTIMTVLPQC